MWELVRKKKVDKTIRKLPKTIKLILEQLFTEIELLGPNRNNWPNYGKLKSKDDLFHCHIKKGNPTYVVCWEILNKKVKIVEVIYVGTHEKAPY